MILLLDHQDSFVQVLADYLAQCGAEPTVLRDDATTFDAIVAGMPRGIVLSPGPGHPRECTLATRVVQELGPRIPILGVCLGHQIIATALGGEVGRAAHPRHGRTSTITHDGAGIFRGIPSPCEVMRYHSLAVAPTSCPEALVVSARAEDGTIMGLRHRQWPLEGVQFHPESILTTHGLAMVRNWLASGE